MSVRVAIPIWQGRVSPVFDTASNLWLCDLDSGQLTDSKTFELKGSDLTDRAAQISRLGISTILCGAVSRLFHRLLEAHRIEIIPWLSGPVEDVLHAYTNGALKQERYRLPGCGRRQCGRQSGRGRGDGAPAASGQELPRRAGKRRRANYRNKQD